VNQLRIGTLAALFAAAVALSWAGADTWDRLGNTTPSVPLLAPVVLALIAVVLFATALSLRSRLRAQRERRPDARPVDRMMAARAVVFGQASALVSALAAGMYGGFGLWLVLERLDVPNRRDQAVYAGCAVVAGIAVVIAGLFLERVCRLPDDDENGGDGPAGSPV
jgi:membrane protease YdiL (CAAX protease family)